LQLRGGDGEDDAKKPFNLDAFKVTDGRENSGRGRENMGRDRENAEREREERGREAGWTNTRNAIVLCLVHR